jgi:hypothetical protein
MGGWVAPTGSTLSEVALGLSKATDITAQLKQIAGSEDPFGKALVAATCYGLSNIASQYQQNPNVVSATAESWANFLNQQVKAVLPPQLASQVSSKVTQFNNAAQLASINPRAAYTYVQACALRGA